MEVIQRFDSWLDSEVSWRTAIVVYTVLGLYYLILLFPIIYLVTSTFKSDQILFANKLILIPPADQFTIGNYLDVFARDEFRDYFVNSTIIAVATTALTLVVSTLGAYSLSRFEFPGHRYMIVGFISSQMLPFVLILIPFFTVMYSLGLIDTYLGIIIAHSVVTVPFSIWLLKGYFDEIPQTLDEAAIMDGCSQMDILGRIVLPLSAPGLSVAGFYTFVGSWNDYLFVSMLSQSQSTRTLPFGLALFQSANAVDWGAVLTAAVITMLPVIMLFAFVQKYIVEGLAGGGMKGI